MVKFSCFNAHIYCHKPKTTFHSSSEAMHKSLQDFSDIHAPKDLISSTHLDGQFKSVRNSSFRERSSKSDEMKGDFGMENNVEFSEMGHLKKSKSLGSGLYLEGISPCENDAEEETDHGFSSDSHEHGLAVRSGSKSPVASTPSEDHKAPFSESVQVGSEHANNGSMFSIGDPQNSGKQSHESPDSPIYGDGEYAETHVEQKSQKARSIVKSCSLPNFNDLVSPIEDEYSSPKHVTPNSRSSDDLRVLDMKKEYPLPRDLDSIQEQERDEDVCRAEKNNFKNPEYYSYETCNYSALAKNWIIPDEGNSVTMLRGESSSSKWDKVPSEDFKIKRIEEWVNDLQHCPLEETEELPLSSSHMKRDPDTMNGLTAVKADVKITPGMEAAKRYISSLSAAATTAQLSNLGLVVIPFLSAFVSLKVLNLSGNAIVRITAGALPRGLHMLNLSKNNISTIEGLRELTRLRVIDLSYNRIFRIGHGLASCSSLKELYLAGNKISEVEGLHRLLKLSVLDLRFNKISTAKCLGQLAANYNSLQAISLEGNPAQKNVGDEHLKKHLQSLLPQLVYFNRQPMKANSLKETADRSVRLGISGHQFDRGLRSENKGSRKTGFSTAHRQSSLSSIHGRKVQAGVSPPKRSRSKHTHTRLPPTGTKATSNHHRYYNFDITSQIEKLKSEFSSMRRSRSEGTLRG